ncbi:hypothetical protein N2152v2_003128 [Parachlorella kessleri]
MGQAASLFTGSKKVRAAVPAAAKKSAGFDKPQEEDPDLWLVVGLGNPGPRYEHTRHNVGFMVIDALARMESITVDRLQENAAVGRGRCCGKKVLLAKPMTFMNNSGESVGRLARFYRVPAERILVVYDDLDLPSAKVRLRAKGGHGGHNGMKSISAHLQGSKDFPRIRVGIGRPEGQMPIPTYVLQDFSKVEREEIDVAIQEGVDLVKAVLTLGMEKAVSGVKHDQPQRPKQPKQRVPQQPQEQQQQQEVAPDRQGGLTQEPMAVTN